MTILGVVGAACRVLADTSTTSGETVFVTPAPVSALGALLWLPFPPPPHPPTKVAERATIRIKANSRSNRRQALSIIPESLAFFGYASSGWPRCRQISKNDSGPALFHAESGSDGA